MGTNSSRQNGLVRTDASNDKPADAGDAAVNRPAGLAGMRYHNLHKSESAGNAQTMTVVGHGSPQQPRVAGGARPGLVRLFGNKRGLRGDMLPAARGAEKSPSVITLYSYDGISAAGESATPSASSVFNSDAVKASSPAVARSRELASDVSSEPFLATANRTTTLTSLSVLALPSHGGAAIAPLDCMKRQRKMPTSMTDTARGAANGPHFLSDTTMTKSSGISTKERPPVGEAAAAAKERDGHGQSFPPGDRRRATALRTQMKTSEAGIMKQLRHEGIVAASATHDELTSKRRQESQSILSELRDMGLVSSSAPGFHDPDAATPRAPARLAAIEQSRRTQLLDLDDAEDLLDTLDMEMQKGDTDYLSFSRERLLRRRRLPICSGAVADTTESDPQEGHGSDNPEAQGDSCKSEQMADIAKAMRNLDLL